MKTEAMVPPATGAGGLEQSLPPSPRDPADAPISDVWPPDLGDSDFLFFNLPRLGCFVANEHAALSSSPSSPQIPNAPPNALSCY